MRNHILFTLLASIGLNTYTLADTIVIKPTVVVTERISADQGQYSRWHHSHVSHHSGNGIGLAFINRNTVRVYHRDLGWSGKWNYVCLEDQCYQGTRRGGYYYRDFPAHLGQPYRTQFKVQDDRTGQYITQGAGRFTDRDRW